MLEYTFDELVQPVAAVGLRVPKVVVRLIVTLPPTSSVVVDPVIWAEPRRQRLPRVAMGILMFTSSMVRQLEVESAYHRLHAATLAPLFRP